MAAGAAITIGLLVFAGWLCQMPMLIQLGAGTASMKANTAFSIMFCGVSLASLLRLLRTEKRNWALVTGLTAIISGPIAVATLCEYAGWDVGIDQIFILGTINHQDTPDRMGLNTAICIGALSLALLFSSFNKRIFYRIAVALTFVSFAISIFTINGYIYILTAVSRAFMRFASIFACGNFLRFDFWRIYCTPTGAIRLARPTFARLGFT